MENLYGYRNEIWKNNRFAERKTVCLPYAHRMEISLAWAVDNTTMATWGPFYPLCASELLHRASKEEKTRKMYWSDLMHWAHDYVLNANYAVRSGIVFA